MSSSDSRLNEGPLGTCTWEGNPHPYEETCMNWRPSQAKPENLKWLLDASNQVIAELGKQEHLDSDTFRWLCNAVGQVERDLKRAAQPEPTASSPLNSIPRVEQIGDKITFCVRGTGRVVEKDEYYTTIATRGLEMTCWNDELTVQPPHVGGSGEQLAAWMIAHSFATGHGDTVEDLLKELEWQVAELRGRGASEFDARAWLNKNYPQVKRELLDQIEDIVDEAHFAGRSNALALAEALKNVSRVLGEFLLDGQPTEQELIMKWRSAAESDRELNAKLNERLQRGEIVTMTAASGPFIDRRDKCADELEAAIAQHPTAEIVRDTVQRGWRVLNGGRWEESSSVVREKENQK